MIVATVPGERMTKTTRLVITSLLGFAISATAYTVTASADPERRREERRDERREQRHEDQRREERHEERREERREDRREERREGPRGGPLRAPREPPRLRLGRRQLRVARRRVRVDAGPLRGRASRLSLARAALGGPRWRLRPHRWRLDRRRSRHGASRQARGALGASPRLRVDPRPVGLGRWPVELGARSLRARARRPPLARASLGEPRRRVDQRRRRLGVAITASRRAPVRAART